MNYAFLRHLAPLLGRSFESDFTGKPGILTLGRTLFTILEDDQASDTELVTRCAETLGIRPWFAWRNFEDMPASYYRDLL